MNPGLGIDYSGLQVGEITFPEMSYVFIATGSPVSEAIVSVTSLFMWIAFGTYFLMWFRELSK